MNNTYDTVDPDDFDDEELEGCSPPGVGNGESYIEQQIDNQGISLFSSLCDNVVDPPSESLGFYVLCPILGPTSKSQCSGSTNHKSVICYLIYLNFYLYP